VFLKHSERNTYTLSKRIIITGIALFILSSCNLSNEATSEVLTTPTPETTTNDITVTEAVENVEIATSTPTQTSQSLGVIQNNQPTNATSDCELDATLATYRVQSGDTLSSIAQATSSTVTELVTLNCLDDANQIAVGQSLVIPRSAITSNDNTNNTQPQNQNSNTNINPPPAQPIGTSDIDVANIPLNPATRYGTLRPSAWIANHISTYILEENAPIVLTWADFPANLNIIQAGLVIKPNNKIGGYTLIGLDTNVTDGVTISWVPPVDAQYDVFAVGQIMGQSELIVSNSIRVGSRNSSIALTPRVYGTTDVSPTVEMISPGEVILDPASVTVTAEWLGTAAFGYYPIGDVSFYYRDATGATLIGVDTNPNDGLSTTFTTFPIMDGVIYAEGEFVQTGAQVFHVKLMMPEVQVSVQIDGCQFFGFGIGAPHPVYPSPDSTTNSLTEIPADRLYAVLAQQSDFVQIDLGEQSGWVQRNLGDFAGNC